MKVGEEGVFYLYLFILATLLHVLSQLCLPVVEVRTVNHWTSRKVPEGVFLMVRDEAKRWALRGRCLRRERN